MSEENKDIIIIDESLDDYEYTEIDNGVYEVELTEAQKANRANTKIKHRREVKTGDVADDPEIINDAVIEKKEDEQKKKDDEANKDDKPATPVSEEKTVGGEDDKPVSYIDDTEDRSEDATSNGNAPVFVDPAQGGPNPFEGGGDSEIDDHNSDEFVDEGGDKPGEGIHF